MSKNIIYGVVGVIVVAAVGGYILMGKPSGGPGGGENAPLGGSRSLKELMALGGSQKCTFASDDETSRTSGVVYLANGKMRSDFEIVEKSANKTVESHSIADGEYMYTWSSEMEQGIKINIADFTAPEQESPTGKGQGVSYDEKMDYDCGSWNADTSLFTPPSGVDFLDAGAMMQGLGGAALQVPSGDGEGSAPSGAAAQCAMCDQVPDAEAKAQCRATLGCL